jgi:superfamily II DNA or RNA helicase
VIICSFHFHNCAKSTGSVVLLGTAVNSWILIETGPLSVFVNEKESRMARISRSRAFDDKIRQAVKDNPEISSAQLERLLGMKVGTAFTRLKRLGIKLRDGHSTKDKPITEAILGLLKGDPSISYAEVASKVGCNRRFVGNVARKNGFGGRDKKLDESKRDAILDALKRFPEKSRPEIAEMFGVGRMTVQHLIWKYKLPRRGMVKNPFTFDEARQWVQSQGIRTYKQFEKAKRENQLHPKMTRHPFMYYAEQWKGYAYFFGTLGKESKWTKITVLAYLGEIKPLIPNLADCDLIQMLREVGVLPVLARVMRTERLTDVMRALRGDHAAEAVVRVREEEIADADGGALNGDVIEDDYWTPQLEINSDTLHAADSLAQTSASEVIIAQVMETQLCGLRAEWVRSGDPSSALAKFNQAGGKFYASIKRRFKHEVQATDALDTPHWNLKKGGEMTNPFPMQKYVAWKMTQSRTLCNWSGTGAGKTGSAGLAAFAIDSHLTIVLAPNSMVDGWQEALEDEFKGVSVYTDVSEAQRAPGSFLVLNYEKFQGVKASSLMAQIAALKPDMFVLDEAHLIKVRDKGWRSARSANIERMLRSSSAKILAMTATPILNELREPVSLIEIATGEKQNLKTRASIPNALDIFQVLRRVGVRFMPNYAQEEKIEKIPSRRDDLMSKLSSAISTGRIEDVLGIERVLIEPKMEAVRDKIEPGTIIYVQYVDEIVSQIRAFVEQLGLTVGEYVGDSDTKERTATKRQFISGEIDVLIGSSAIKLGVDGLQERCGRMIIASLPWTHADFLQVVGRIRRTGSKFRKAEIYIPQIVLGADGNRWSWDESRFAHIEGKHTLADCVCDGVVPNDTGIDKTDLVKKAKKALERLTKLQSKSAWA